MEGVNSPGRSRRTYLIALDLPLSNPWHQLRASFFAIKLSVVSSSPACLGSYLFSSIHALLSHIPRKFCKTQKNVAYLKKQQQLAYKFQKNQDPQIQPISREDSWSMRSTAPLTPVSSLDAPQFSLPLSWSSLRAFTYLVVFRLTQCVRRFAVLCGIEFGRRGGCTPCSAFYSDLTIQIFTWSFGAILSFFRTSLSMTTRFWSSTVARKLSALDVISIFFLLNYTHESIKSPLLRINFFRSKNANYKH